MNLSKYEKVNRLDRRHKWEKCGYWESKNGFFTKGWYRCQSCGWRVRIHGTTLKYLNHITRKVFTKPLKKFIYNRENWFITLMERAI